MSLLGKYNQNLIEDEEQKNKFKTPSVMITDDEDLTLKKSILLSAFLHPASIGVILATSLILTFFGINLDLFKKPEMKKKDIEFVLVDKEATPINKNTPYRSDKDSQAGGQHDPTKKVTMPSPAPGVVQQAQPQAQPKQEQPKVVSQPTPKPVAKPVEKTVTKPVETPQPVQQAPQPVKTAEQPKPQPPTARPSVKPPSTPKTVAKPTTPFTVPVPKAGTTTGAYTTGPISGSGTATVGSSNSATGSYAPTPSLSPSASSSGSNLKMAQSGGGGTGSYGNPGPGNPNGQPGIDAIREPDFGPYMRELQRRIKTNWDPPKGDESKRVVLVFKIGKQGELLSCSVFKSSGLPNADKAAIYAVQSTAPFKPLPADFKGQNIDIQFTFDYNVLGASRYN